MSNRKVLMIGMKEEFHKTITEYDANAFAGLTGDFSRIHMDHEFAKNTRFGRPIAQGLIAASYPSTIMGTKLPGSGTIFLDEKVEFKNPVFYGDTIDCTLEFVGSVEKKNCYIGEFIGICTNQRGEVVNTVHAHQMMPKEYFEVVDPEDQK